MLEGLGITKLAWALVPGNLHHWWSWQGREEGAVATLGGLCWTWPPWSSSRVFALRAELSSKHQSVQVSRARQVHETLDLPRYSKTYLFAAGCSTSNHPDWFPVQNDPHTVLPCLPALGAAYLVDHIRDRPFIVGERLRVSERLFCSGQCFASYSPLASIWGKPNG